MVETVNNLWRTENDWPEGFYYGKCCTCSKSYTGPKRSIRCYKCETQVKESPPDFEAIRKTKRTMMMKFEEARKVAEANGYILVKKI